MWPIRIAASKLRPLDAAAILRLAIVAAIFAAFLYGDYRLFVRFFAATQKVEAATPFFAIGLVRNLVAMVLLVATVVLFSSAMTAAIGALFTDLDLEIHHAAPRTPLRVATGRWAKALFESAGVVFAFLVPLFVAFGRQYHLDAGFYVAAAAWLVLLLTIPVSLGATAILLLVRFFPVRRVHQIVATIAAVILTLAVTALRMSRPERFFADIATDDVVRVLKAIDLPSMELYPSTALAAWMADCAGGGHAAVPLRIALLAIVLFATFAAVAYRHYFPAFVRARETMAPVAIGSTAATRVIDRLLRPFDVHTRALAAKEIRILGRDAAQWSQLFMMAALLFVYLYNVRILPLSGDMRATLVAYANVGMAGFVVAALCLRFAYPTVALEGRAFWLIETAPISYRRFLLVKVAVYATPLTILSILLTALTNLILGAGGTVWLFTIGAAAILPLTLVSLGVGMGAFRPNFNVENPLQVGLSLGGFAYMAVSLAYVGVTMVLMARPVARFFMSKFLGLGEIGSAVVPIAAAVALSVLLMSVPIAIAERRLAHRT